MSESSVQVPQIYGLMAKVMADFGAVAKLGTNSDQHYGFRRIDDLYDAAHVAMSAHGVFCTPEAIEYHTEERVTAKGTVMLRVRQKIALHFYAPDGSRVTSTVWGEGIDTSDKATNKATTGAFKYAIVETFVVPFKLDDADETTPEVGRKAASAERTTAPTQLPPPPTAPKAEPVRNSGPSPYINKATQQKFHMRFRDAWVAAGGAAKMSELGLSTFLATNGYLIDDYKGTTSLIPMDKVKDVWAQAEEYIKANVIEAPGMDDEEAAQ